MLWKLVNQLVVVINAAVNVDIGDEILGTRVRILAFIYMCLVGIDEVGEGDG